MTPQRTLTATKVAIQLGRDSEIYSHFDVCKVTVLTLSAVRGGFNGAAVDTVRPGHCPRPAEAKVVGYRAPVPLDGSLRSVHVTGSGMGGLTQGWEPKQLIESF